MTKQIDGLFTELGTELFDRLNVLEHRVNRLEAENRYLRERMIGQDRWIDNLRSQVRDLVDKEGTSD